MTHIVQHLRVIGTQCNGPFKFGFEKLKIVPKEVSMGEFRVGEGILLIGLNGTLRGVGSLYVEDAAGGDRSVPGNMMVPIDLLKPILSELAAFGRVRRKQRPWLGLFTAEAMGHLFVAGVAPGGPADDSGLESGDVIVSLNGRNLDGMIDLYRKLWAIGPAGVTVHFTVLRGGDAIDVPIHSADRYDFLKSPMEH